MLSRSQACQFGDEARGPAAVIVSLPGSRILATNMLDGTRMEYGSASLEGSSIWRELCALAGDLVFATDPRGRIELVVAHGANRLGHSADTLTGRTLASLLPAADPLPEQDVRLAPVRLRGADGAWQHCLISLRAREDGGRVGLLIVVDEAGEGASNDELAVKRVLDRVLARMHDEVLAPRVIGTALDELRKCLGADGTAVVAPASAYDPDHGTPRLAHVSGQTGAIATLPIVPCARRALEDEQLFTAGSIEGHGLVAVPIPLRYGKPSALVAWRLDQTEWSAHDRALLTASANILGAPIETDNVQRDLTRHARTDMLTGLLTRRSFLEEVCRRLARLDREGLAGTIMSIDLDAFGVFNERHGPERGDDALRYVAALLRDAIRPTDLAARLGADDFVVWLDGADSFAAAERAERLCRTGIEVRADDEMHRFTVSVGLASRSPGSDENIDEILRRANAARLHARRSGGGGWRTSQEEMSP